MAEIALLDGASADLIRRYFATVVKRDKKEVGFYLMVKTQVLSLSRREGSKPQEEAQRLSAITEC